MAKEARELEQAFITSLADETGATLAEWMSVWKRPASKKTTRS